MVSDRFFILETRVERFDVGVERFDAAAVDADKADLIDAGYRW